MTLFLRRLAGIKNGSWSLACFFKITGHPRGMTRRKKSWLAAFLSGAAGWYLLLSFAEVVPGFGAWWINSLVGLLAVITWLYSSTVVNQDFNLLCQKLASTKHYTRCDILKEREKKIAAWLMVPYCIWFSPSILAFFGGLNIE